MPLTFFDKVWNEHVIGPAGDDAVLLHVDRHLLHELSGAVALRALAERGRPPRNPSLTFGTIDHVLETKPGRGLRTSIRGGNDFLREFTDLIGPAGVTFFDLDDPRQGIVHVIAPELGIALPGSTIVCGDSHTCTLGGVGAVAFGVGSSDSEHVLATQCIVLTKPARMRVDFNGRLPDGVSAKDLILKLITSFGAAGGGGYAIEFAGEAVRALPVSGRLTLCNMAVEFGGRTGMIAPDEVTFDYLYKLEFSPKGAAWDRAVRHWRTLVSDEEARYDAVFTVDCADLSPQITWGTSPDHTMPIDGAVPAPNCTRDPARRAQQERALAYMGLEPGQSLLGQPIRGVFLGSCTNGRIEDLRDAAALLKGRKIAPGVLAICSPGSSTVKWRAEREGLARIFIDAGFEWRESGCSLCISGGMGGDAFPNGARIVTSTNRNFENRQGPGVRSHLASPATVAASALAGVIADPRRLVS